jgi:hypothetical protein
MSEKQRLKHIADRQPQPLNEISELIAAESTPDGLGPYEGGRLELRGSNTWVAQKSHSSRTADSKNTPRTDYATKITHRQDADFNEIHTDANGQFWLYNLDTDAWDIAGDSADIPYYEDAKGWLWGYNVKTGAWDVPVEEQEYI